MANIDNTFLTSNDPKIFDEITKNLTFENEDSVIREPGKMFIRTRWGVPHKDIKALSKKNPEITFNAKFSFESVRYDTIHCVEYQAGKDELIGLEHGYMQPVLEHLESRVPCYEELLNKAIEIFERIDVVKDLDDGEKIIDWYEPGVAVFVENADYQMRVTKRGSNIEEVKCWKAREVKTIEWDEIRDDQELDEIPF